MPVDPEKIAPGKCYKFNGSAPRHVLLMHEGKLTYVLRGPTSWAVQRYHQDVESFARAAEFEIDYATLRPVAEASPADVPPSDLPTELPS